MKLFIKAQSAGQKAMTRVQDALKNKKGMTMVEIIVLISVILVIATVLYAFRGQITTFLNNAGGHVSNLSVGSVS